MSINPGTGYTLAAGSGSFNLSVNQPWMDYSGAGSGPSGPSDINVAPAQLSTQVLTPKPRAPWSLAVQVVNGQQYLRIVSGTVNYAMSNMPVIKTGAFAQSRQAVFSRVQISPSGSFQSSIFPAGTTQDPEPETEWMQGGYLLDTAEESYDLYAFKWDADPAQFSDGSGVIGESPTLALLANSNTADFVKINKDAGPTIYEQATNVQKMTGYRAEDTELPGDWGHCHTTWVNPRKIGYSMRRIGSATQVANVFSASVFVVNPGVPAVCNAVHAIRFSGVASGTVNFTFTYVIIVDGSPVTQNVTTTIPFPVADVYSSGGVIRSDEFALANSLNSIPALVGNFTVSKAGPGLFYVTFVNRLQQSVVTPLAIDSSSVTAPDWAFEVKQYVTGTVDLSIGLQSGMNQLMNVADMDEAQDPYNLNKDGSPDWKDIANRGDFLACKSFSGDVISTGWSPITFADAPTNPEFTIAAGCTPEPSADHPFKVKYAGEVDGESQWTVVSGSVNNVVPYNMGDTLGVTDGWIWLEIPYDSTAKVFPKASDVIIVSGAMLPVSDADYSYVALAQITTGVASQLVTGSLWGDRIQVGNGSTQTAQYFYANV